MAEVSIVGQEKPLGALKPFGACNSLNWPFRAKLLEIMVIESEIPYNFLIYTLVVTSQITEPGSATLTESLECIEDTFRPVTPLNGPLGQKCFEALL